MAPYHHQDGDLTSYPGCHTLHKQSSASPSNGTLTRPQASPPLPAGTYPMRGLSCLGGMALADSPARNAFSPFQLEGHLLQEVVP